jgi:uncharacterized membrane protein
MVTVVPPSNNPNEPVPGQKVPGQQPATPQVPPSVPPQVPQQPAVQQPPVQTPVQPIRQPQVNQPVAPQGQAPPPTPKPKQQTNQKPLRGEKQIPSKRGADQQNPEQEQSLYDEQKAELSTSLENMDPNIAAAISYILPPFTGIALFLFERKHKFVKFHAFQSLLFGLVAWAAMTISRSLPYVGDLLFAVVRIITIFLWLFLMWKAYNKDQFELPVIGKIAKDQVLK